MKKVALFGFGLSVLVLFMIFIWIQFPHVNHPQVVAAAQKEALKRHQARQETAQDPSQNGFLNPRFRDYWQGHNSKPTLAEKRIAAWAVFSTATGATRLDHRELSQDQIYLKTRGEFEELLPDMLAEFHKSVFVAPAKKLTIEGTYLDYLNMRSVAQALVGLAESYISEGRPREALRPALECLQLGALLSRQGTAINNFIGVSLQQLGANAFGGLFSPKTQLSAEQWRSTGRAILACVVPAKNLEEAVEDSLLMIANTFGHIRGNRSARRAFTGGGVAYEIPGMIAREERITLNLVTDVLLQLQQGQTVPPSTPSKPGDWIRGKEGLLTSGLLGDHHRMQELALGNRQHLLGLGVSCLLLAQRLESGEFPNDLASLEVEGCSWDPETAQLAVPLAGASSHPERFQLNLYTDSPWLSLGKDQLVFHLAK